MTFLEWLLSWWRPKPPKPGPKPPPVPPQPLAERLLALHNAERAKARLPALRGDSRLTSAAQTWAEQMAAAGTLRHGDFSARIRSAGYVWRTVAENVGEGWQTPEEAVHGWMASAGHKHNILGGAYRDVGFGVARDETGILWWCADFGSE